MFSKIKNILVIPKRTIVKAIFFIVHIRNADGEKNQLNMIDFYA